MIVYLDTSALVKLFIAEAGNWQMTPEQMASPAMREKFQQQMREMIERGTGGPPEERFVDFVYLPLVAR